MESGATMRGVCSQAFVRADSQAVPQLRRGLLSSIGWWVEMGGVGFLVSETVGEVEVCSIF